MDYDECHTLAHVAGPVSRETCEALKAYSEDLARWTKRINLISASTVQDRWRRHILDSAQLVGIAGRGAHWLDLGSGAGLPGLVVAFLAKESGTFVTLVESNLKKVSFLRSVVANYDLPATVRACRIEHLDTVHADFVSARAVAPLEHLLRLAAPWLTKRSVGLFHKGGNARAELAECSKHWAFDLIEHPSKVEADGVILQISSLRSKPKQVSV